MPYILSTGIRCADHSFTQSDIQKLVYNLFPLKEKEKKRLLPIFENAEINERQFAAPLAWFKDEHGLQERNELYHTQALQYCTQAVQSCLTNEEMLSVNISPELIDHILFISSTGISTPTLDTYLMNELKFDENTRRTPLFGLGCAGGTSGVAKAQEWLLGHPEKNVLIVCVELCSITFQPGDSRVSNFVGTALFGDGASAVLVIGDQSPLRQKAKVPLAKILKTSSRTKRYSTNVMGWRVIDTGFEVIFNKSIPRLVKEFWSVHAREFTENQGWKISEFPFIIAHPGGRKVLEGYREAFNLNEQALEISKNILKRHGNMSSPTVHFVLHEALKKQPVKGTRTIMTSLGPGFSSEMVSLEWM
ncbi:alkylresorcinol/alkylpyrone synthase [Halobacillus dabanensis]|uniref:Alkylresorcinol/alkylpyrone synthase n=1 Tax=Halobacillus dabanensis TaxID=240302 RepID=A0A1I3VVY5_HALDA|nr:3-oxoacyl-[acyl-carrier-protein] synthase III C-terminal domain-containing protein [Halobacillus dabanensis]SFJ99299.1 alkylresorcinol/alkylpyrone synthase [Halobacillus dabanensis]